MEICILYEKMWKQSLVNRPRRHVQNKENNKKD